MIVSFNKNVLSLLLLILCLEGNALAQGPNNELLTTETEYKTIEWPDLIPQEDLSALPDPPIYNINPEMNGQAVRIPGYIVPLEFNDEMIVTEFFIVSFFGACIHVPPPPPNQIIHVNYPRGFELEALYDPFWVSGVLKTSLIEDDTTNAAYAMYAMEMQSLETYSEE